MTLTPLSCQLMGWRGADQNGFANNGANWFCGGLLLFLGGLLEFFLGHTFAFVVYAAYGEHNLPPNSHLGVSLLTSSLQGGFFLALGATLTPGFNAEAPYMNGSSAVLGAT